MSHTYEAERGEVYEALRRIVAAGLVSAASGNVSRRIRTGDGDLIAVTASRVPYDRFTVDDVLVCDFEVEPIAGAGVPSSESLTHVAVYRARPDVDAVIHTHSPYASAFAVAGEPIPCVLDEQVISLGGAIQVAAYASSASVELAENAAVALGDRAAVLLRHHGAVGVGADLDEAVAVVELLEHVASVAAIARFIGGARELPADVAAAQERIYKMMRGFGMKGRNE